MTERNDCCVCSRCEYFNRLCFGGINLVFVFGGKMGQGWARNYIWRESGYQNSFFGILENGYHHI